MKTLLIYTLCVIAVFSVVVKVGTPLAYASGVNYVPLAPIDVPGSEFTSKTFSQNSECKAPTCLPKYLRTIYNIGIAMAGLFAVFSIVRGGFTLIFTDSILGHSEAKGIILRALGGLVIVYSSYIFMNQISPSLGRELDLSLNFDRITIKEDLSTLQVVTSESVQDAWRNQLKTINPEIRSLKEQAAEKRALALTATDNSAKEALTAEANRLDAQALALEGRTIPSVNIKNAYRQALGALWDVGYDARYNIKDANGAQIPLESASRAQRIYAAEQFLKTIEDQMGKINALPSDDQKKLTEELSAAKIEIQKQIDYAKRGCKATGKDCIDSSTYTTPIN